MVSPRRRLMLLGELHLAGEKATSVGDFHRRIAELLKSKQERVTITQRNNKGDILNQFVIYGKAVTSVLQYYEGGRSMIHMFQQRLNEMHEDPTGTHLGDLRRNTVYNLLSSAMQIVAGNTVDGISIDIL